MVKIEIIINGDHIDDVLKSVSNLEINMLNFFEISSIGNPLDQTTVYRGVSHSKGYTSKIKIEILTSKEKISDLKTALSELVKNAPQLSPIEVFFTDIVEFSQFS
ncbi:P-II family nitrogen regulator [Anditalea andensis]|uniref:Nitrogen regulatory protein P-II n=1 Tax=Anditalea andensis TaxID=1048983 RepID=A0A074KW61_9BACT|nr:P-II family nitrogen regulator [Anditalea andensis]KEO73149.1 hypothetical protein EL17_12375 [Anditalea andensis]